MLYGQNKIPTICSENIFLDRDSLVLISITDNCVAYKNYCTNATAFLLNYINRKIAYNYYPVKRNNIFPGPPVANRGLVDNYRIADPSSGHTVSEIVFYPLTSGHGFKTKYALPPHWRYSFQIHKIPADKERLVQSNLDTLIKIGLYDKIKKEIEFSVPFLVTSDQFASYIQSYDLTDTAILNGINMDLESNIGKPGMSAEELAEYPKKKIENAPPTKLWVECYIPIDSSDIPVGIPERNVTPVAVQTKKGLYVYSETIEPALFAGPGLFTQFENPVFDLSACKNLDFAYQKVIEIFREEISEQFRNYPLHADLITGLAPNQLRFERRFEESNVLKGFSGPYYELSTYTINFWSGPKGIHINSGAGYQNSDAYRKNYRNDHIFLVEMTALQINVGKKGGYPEPTNDQYSAYAKEVRKALLNAVENTTKQLNGKFNQNTGIGIITLN